MATKSTSGRSSMECVALVAHHLLTAPAPLTVPELAEEISESTARVYSALLALEHTGWIVKRAIQPASDDQARRTTVTVRPGSVFTES